MAFKIMPKNSNRKSKTENILCDIDSGDEGIPIEATNLVLSCPVSGILQVFSRKQSSDPRQIW